MRHAPSPGLPMRTNGMLDGCPRRDFFFDCMYLYRMMARSKSQSNNNSVEICCAVFDVARGSRYPTLRRTRPRAELWIEKWKNPRANPKRIFTRYSTPV